MKGLEISEILKSGLERTSRIDSEFYTKENLAVLKAIDTIPSNPITKYLRVSDGNHLSISEFYSEEGVPYYRGGDIYNFFIEQNSDHLKIPLNVFNTPNMKRSHLHKGDVLVSIVGAIIGNLSLVKKQTLATCSCKLAILRPESIKPELVAIFFKSKYGQNQIQKFRRGSGQTGFILEDFDQLIIPEFSNAFALEIEAIVNKAYQNVENSLAIYNRAESILLEATGLNDFEPTQESINIKYLKESFCNTKRLDAEFYQKKYEEYENLVVSQKHTFIKTEYTHIITKAKKDKLAYNYIEIGDINVRDGSNKSNYILTNELPANAKTLVKKGDILISNVRPYRGAVTIINTEEKDLIVSGAFTVLRKSSKSIYNNEVLKVLLRSTIYKDWLLKFNVGTSYPVIKDEDVLNLPIPFVSDVIQKKIAEMVEESFNLKAESERLLEVAKKAIEIAIEQNEETSMKFIKDNN